MTFLFFAFYAIIIFVIIMLFFFINLSKTIKKYNILIFLFSCDRDIFLNNTLYTLFKHLRVYEKNISYTFIFSDSGTLSRDLYIRRFQIYNILYMNPTKYNYVYKIAFSMLYMKYVLFMEDDRPFIDNIERKIIHKNYIEEGIAILEASKRVYGVTYKPDIPSITHMIKLSTYLGEHILCLIVKPKNGYYYVNGPSLYKSYYLTSLKNYESELSASKYFKRLNLLYGYTFKNLKCKKSVYSIDCQSVSIHLARNKNYSTTGIKHCNNYLY